MTHEIEFKTRLFNSTYRIEAEGEILLTSPYYREEANRTSAETFIKNVARWMNQAESLDDAGTIIQEARNLIQWNATQEKCLDETEWPETITGLLVY